MALTFCVLGSGSGGNCTLVRAGRTGLLIDAGFSVRDTARRLALAGSKPEDVSAILVTHEHSDHVGGAAVLSRRWRLPVLCRPDVAERARLRERGAWGLEPLPPAAFPLGDLEITPFEVPHDAVETVGVTVRGEGILVGYATDLGERTPTVARHLRGCHIVALEANHDVELTRQGPYPRLLKERILGRTGHLSNAEAASLLAEVIGPETRRVVLAHLSRVNNEPRLALSGARAGLARSANPHVSLEAAGQAAPATPVVL